MNKRVVSIVIVSVLIVAILAAVAAVLIPTGGKDKGENKPQYTVSFFANGKLLEEQKVTEGEAAQPPAVPLNVGKVFSGWDTDVSNVTEDLIVKALFEELGDGENIFIAENAYLKQDKTVVVNVALRGKVNIATADFAVEYDKQKLKLEEISFADPAIEANHVETDGKVKCSLLSLENITGEVDCLQLVFSAVESGSFKTDIKIIVDDASRLENDKIVDAEYESVNGSVTVVG